MKKSLSAALSLTMAFLMAFFGIVQVFADSRKTYVSEVKVAMGGSAESDLTNEGFIILRDDNGSPIDLNQGAGGGKYSQGNRKVLMGYKTTTDITEAITDLAVMNMEGGYDVEEYDLLMKRYLGAQISPFIDGFLTTINEYRENIESENEVNRARAEYVRAALNQYTDDDCGGAGLGDLLLNETVYEMAKPVFDKLPAKEQEERGIGEVNAEMRDAIPAGERSRHCDILTLFAQADGQVMLTIYALLTRAADTSDDSWIDRFVCMTYDDLLDSYDMAPTDAKKKAARDFDDDARIILKSWEDFCTLLLAAPAKAELLKAVEFPDLDVAVEKVAALDENSSDDEIVTATAECAAAESGFRTLTEMGVDAVVAGYLSAFDYGDGTLYDFFTRPTSEMAADITSLYPLVAALSEGQRSGIEFLSLREFVLLSDRETLYSPDDFDETTTVSVFDGIDRTIYKTGGVALTSDALRTKALEKQKNLADRSLLSTKTIVLWASTALCAVGFIASAATWKTLLAKSEAYVQNSPAQQFANATQTVSSKMAGLRAKMKGLEKYALDGFGQPQKIITNKKLYMEYYDKLTELEKADEETWNNAIGEYISSDTTAYADQAPTKVMAATPVAKWMSVGFAAVTFILAGVSAWMTWQDLKDYYKVDFSPIPRFMVDETGITYYNERGEKLVKENHAAYYEAVKCNRKDSDQFFNVLGDRADMNGDVGQQWLALYACKDYEEMQPILADSFRVVVGNSEIPAGYDNTGIHMFGSDSAFNLNSKLYDWNQSAKSVFVYFKIDEAAPLGDASTSGSAFSAGIAAVIGVCGVGLGALVTAVAMTAVNKRKSKKATAAA